MAETTLDEQAKALRLGISNDEIAKRITNDPSFRGINGQFDRARFEAIIRQAGFSEGRFVEEQRRVMLRRQIALSLSGDIRVPTTAMDAINQFQNEKRAIEYLAWAQPKPAIFRSRRPNSSANISRNARSCSARPNTAR